jgi:DedD protein
MAKSISAEELQLKKRARRRLIGAIALVTIVAVFLPMVLDHEPRPVVQDISIQIPSPGSGSFTSKIVPLPPGPSDGKSAAKAAEAAKAEPLKSDTPATATPPAAVAAAPEAKPAAETPAKPPAYDTEAAPPKKAEPAPKPAAKAAPKLAAKSAPAPKAAAKPADAKSAGGFVVQVAALNDADKAKQMRDSIAASGIKSYTEVVPTVKGNVTRVRAGPFASRAEAEKMRDKLKDMGLPGNIVPK